jgi:phosphatidate cytidylyltransferase
MGARILTAVIGIPLLLYAAGAGNSWPLRVVLAALGVVALIEFLRVEGYQKPPLWGSLVLAGFLTALCFWHPTRAASPWFLALYAIPVIEWATKETPRPLLFAGWVLLPLLAALSLRAGSLSELEHWGVSLDRNLLILLLLCLWAGDSMAFFIGRTFGKHKMAPSVSPSKTWEGAVANLVACAIVGWAFSATLQVPTEAGIGIGVIAGILGQAGDLFQSSWKRRFKAKDSGVLLPGHGGVLDRFDSLLFCLPAANALAFLLMSQG